MDIDEEFIKRVISSVKCSVCGHSYQTGNIDVMGHQDDLWILRIQCSSCATQGLVAAVIKKSMTPETSTDLTTAELVKFKRIEPIGINDVLDIHNLLQGFDQDISTLLSE